MASKRALYRNVQVKLLLRCLFCVGVIAGLYHSSSIKIFTERLIARGEGDLTINPVAVITEAADNQGSGTRGYYATGEDSTLPSARSIEQQGSVEKPLSSIDDSDTILREKTVRKGDRIWPHLHSHNYTALVQLVAEGEALPTSKVSKDLRMFIHATQTVASDTQHHNETNTQPQQSLAVAQEALTTEQAHSAYNECTQHLRPRKLRWMVWLQKHIADAFGNDKKCRWWLTHGSAITALRRRTVPWEHDVDVAIVEEDERRCVRLLVDSGDFNILDKLYNSKGQPREKELKKGWFVRYRLNPFVNGKVVYDVHADIHMFTITTVKERGRKQAYIQQKCTKRFHKTKRECVHRHEYSTVFPLTKYTLRAGFEVNGPADVKKYTDTMYPSDLLLDNQNVTVDNTSYADEPIEKNYVTQGRAEVACIEYAHVIGWVQDYLLDGFWTYLKKEPSDNQSKIK